MEPYIHKVQYYETDQMAIVHHSNYIRWFEEARIYMLDMTGCDFASVEREGIQIPVLGVTCQYHSMVRFGDSVKIIPRLTKISPARFSVSYEIRDVVTDELRTTGTSDHCFIKSDGTLISLKKENKDMYDKLCSLLEK